MIKSVVYKFDNIENCTPRISIDEQNEISITLQVVLKDDVIIKDLANRLQTKVKEEMKKTSDLDVKNVNKNFWNQYKGAIIGIVVAILILCTKLYDLIIGCVVIILGAMVGSYVQKNKDIVKEKLKNFIDRL